jgi:hypothetical protein
MILYQELLQRSSSVSLLLSLVSIAALPEHAPIPVPSCALGANDGATIICSAAMKVCAVLSVGALTLCPPTIPLSMPRKWMLGIVLIAAPRRRRSVITQPWIGNARSGNTAMIGNGCGSSSLSKHNRSHKWPPPVH